MEVYILVEEAIYGKFVIGVFTTLLAVEKGMIEYYGDGFEVLHTQDVRDSGIEWTKDIRVDGEILTLTLQYYTVDEV